MKTKLLSRSVLAGVSGLQFGHHHRSTAARPLSNCSDGSCFGNCFGGCKGDASNGRYM